MTTLERKDGGDRMEQTGPVHLLLNAPGQPPITLPDAPWRMWVVGAQATVDPATAAAAARPSPMSHRSERSLIGAVAAADVEALSRLSTQSGPAQAAAQVLYAGRLAPVDPRAAAEVLSDVIVQPADPGTNKVLRRHWAGLHCQVSLAPGAPALVPVHRIGLGLLLAELLSGLGRPVDALALLESLPPHPPVVLARAATLLANGQHERVLEVTAQVAGHDDIEALTLVARSVAARTRGELVAAHDATCSALAAPRSPAVTAAALEERAHVYTLAQEDLAARSDLEALSALAGGAEQVLVPEATPLQVRSQHQAEAHDLDRARNRMRRRITGVGEPGTFGGRHHSTYRDEIAVMFSLGQVAAVEELLLGLLDAVEDEVAERGVPLDPTFFLTLADLYQDNGRTEELHALRERFSAAQTRADMMAKAAAEAGQMPPPAPTLANPPVAAAPVTTTAPPVPAAPQPVAPITPAAPVVPGPPVEPAASVVPAAAQPVAPAANHPATLSTPEATSAAQPVPPFAPPGAAPGPGTPPLFAPARRAPAPAAPAPDGGTEVFPPMTGPVSAPAAPFAAAASATVHLPTAEETVAPAGPAPTPAWDDDQEHDGSRPAPTVPVAPAPGAEPVLTATVSGPGQPHGSDPLLARAGEEAASGVAVAEPQALASDPHPSVGAAPEEPTPSATTAAGLPARGPRRGLSAVAAAARGPLPSDDEADDEPTAAPAERELTPVERTVRGPRVRSL